MLSHQSLNGNRKYKIATPVVAIRFQQRRMEKVHVKRRFDFTAILIWVGSEHFCTIVSGVRINIPSWVPNWNALDSDLGSKRQTDGRTDDMGSSVSPP